MHSDTADAPKKMIAGKSYKYGRLIIKVRGYHKCQDLGF